ncbi:MAG: flagellar biosynthetic protein FliO [Phycisphaerales bacterium]|nr:MAG: flagellar biosynthetic protein FliO [Phycisphaerales bacterium]
MSNPLGQGWTTRGRTRACVRFPLKSAGVIGAAALLGALPALAQQAGEPTEPVANTAQAIQETPSETVITHRQSAFRARQDGPEDATLLPARSEEQNTTLWLKDRWYVTGVVSLGLVLGLIFLLGYLVRRFILPKVRMGGRDLEVLARTYVGNKQSVALIRAGRRVLVVGVTASRVNLLTCLDDSLEAAHLIGGAAADKSGSISSQFARRLEDEAQQYANTEAHEASGREKRPEVVTQTRRQLQAAIDRMRGFGRAGNGAEVPDGEELSEPRVAG